MLRPSFSLARLKFDTTAKHLEDVNVEQQEAEPMSTDATIVGATEALAGDPGVKDGMLDELMNAEQSMIGVVTYTAASGDNRFHQVYVYRADKHLTTLLMELLIAKPGDVFNIHIIVDNARYADMISLSSAIRKTEATVKVILSQSETLGTLLMWLSAPQREVMPLGIITIKTIVASMAFGNEMADLTEHLVHLNETALSTLCANKIITEDEKARIINNREVIYLTGEELKRRVSSSAPAEQAEPDNEEHLSA